jgi:hypothetical protein
MVFLCTSIARTRALWGTWINTAGSFRMWLGPPHGGQPTQDAERAGRSILTDQAPDGGTGAVDGNGAALGSQLLEGQVHDILR